MLMFYNVSLTCEAETTVRAVQNVGRSFTIFVTSEADSYFGFVKHLRRIWNILIIC